MKSFQNLPPGIAEKVTLLKQHREQIKRLTEECARLEQELAPYNSSISAIHQCPPEILVDIFQFYLEENPRLIRRLIFVCRNWFSIVTQTPTLWTSIPIVIDTCQVDAKDVAESISRRVDAFLRYSCTLPLNISIDLEHLVSVWNFVRSQQDHIHRLLSANIQFDWLHERKSNCHYIMEDAKDKPWNPSHIVKLLRLLAGQDGEGMERWAILELKMPHGGDEGNYYLLEPLWNIFQGPTPRLTELHITNGEIFNYCDSLPSLPSLTHLGAKDTNIAEYLVKRGSLRPDQLEHLVVTCDRAREFEELKEFTSLRTLSTIADEYERLGPGLYFTTLRLPLLQEISFEGGATSTEGVTFDLPCLNHVLIERGHPICFTELPNLESKTVSWFITELYREKWPLGAVQSALTALLKRYHMMEELTISRRHLVYIKEVIRELRKAGALSSSLRLVHVVDNSSKDEVEMTYMIHNLV